MGMKKIILFTLLIAFLQFPVHGVAQEPALEMDYACHDLEGKERWKATTEVIARPEKGEHIYELVENGKGLYSGFKEKIIWHTTMDFESGEDYVKPIFLKKEIFDIDRKPIAIQTQEFSYKRQEVVCTNENIDSGKKKKKVFKFKKEAINRLTLALYIQKFLEKGDTKRKTYMVTDEPQFYKVDIKTVSQEIIDINGAQTKTYKLCIDPKLGIFDIVKLVIPKSYIWHLGEPDFAWIKFKGLESNPSSPQVEIISLKQKK